MLFRLCDEKERQGKELTATAPEEMWVTDLDNIEEAWEETLRLKAAVDANAPKKKKKGGKKKKKKSAVTMDESDEDDWAPPVSKKKKKAVKKTKPIKKATSSSLSSLASHAMPVKKMPVKKMPVVKKVVLAKIAQPKKTAKTHNNKDFLASLDDMLISSDDDSDDVLSDSMDSLSLGKCCFWWGGCV